MNRKAVIVACLTFGSLLMIAVTYIASSREADQVDNRQVERIEITDLPPIEVVNTKPVERIEISDLAPIEVISTQPAQRPAPLVIGERYASVGDYFKAGNPNATTYRLGEPWTKRKSFSASQRAKIHKENGGCCQVCGSTRQLEVEHWRGLQNGGGNERSNLKSLCHRCHVEKTAMDKSLRRQRDKLLQQRRRESKALVK